MIHNHNGIQIIYRRHNPITRQLVNGHWVRSITLAKALDRAGITSHNNVVIYDGRTPTLNDDSRVVIQIIDFPDEAAERADYLVAHHPDALFWRKERVIKRPDQLCLFGPQYFLLRDEYRTLSSEHFDYICYVPGGNSLIFWNVIGDNPPLGIVIKGATAGRAAYNIAHAGIVVASASTAALEALCLGKRLLIVKTAEDQQPVINGIERYGLDIAYSSERLANWCALPMYTIGNRDGADVAANIIKGWISEK